MRSTGAGERRLRRLVVAACLAVGLLVPGVAAAAGPTLVTLTFDDGLSDQYGVRSMLAQHSLSATFFINSNNIGAGAGYLTWSQLSDLAADGNEIGGHTLDHVDLTSVTATEAQRQVCDDRQALVSHGFAVNDFAYPYGARDSSLFSIIQGCGYSSARRSWGLCDIGLPPDCGDVAETIPPQNIWETRTIPSIKAWNTLADLQSVVTRAETSGGGWVTLVLHHVCDGCDPDSYSVTPSILGAFLDWLAPRAASGTYVRTVRDVVGDNAAPRSSITCDGGGCTGWHAAPVSVTLSATDAGTAVAAIRYTTDGSDPTASSTLYAGAFAISATTTVKYRAWDAAGNVEAVNSQPIQVDATAPVSSIACNGTACSGTAYTSAVSVTLSATDAGSGVAAIRYTTDGSNPTVSSTPYTAAIAVSSTTTVKYRAWDAVGNAEATKSQPIQINTTSADTTPPTSTISCNGAACASGWYGTSVSATLSATDAGSGVAAIRYTTDGSDPTASSTLYAGTFAISATTTVKFRAWDKAGNVEPTNTRLIQIDTIAPTVSIGSPAGGATVSGNIKVVAAPADAMSGVASVAFYLDGSLLGSTSTSPWQVAWNTKKSATGQHVLWAVAVDRAGNRRTSASVTVTVS